MQKAHLHATDVPEHQGVQFLQLLVGKNLETLSRAVLIITQTRAAHEEIAEVIRRVEVGDPPIGLPDKSWPGAGGMGGFGGGFF